LQNNAPQGRTRAFCYSVPVAEKTQQKASPSDRQSRCAQQTGRRWAQGQGRVRAWIGGRRRPRLV